MVGSWGYNIIEAFRELMDEGVLENFDDIVVATGSGGTICGLAVGNYLTGQKVKYVSCKIGTFVNYIPVVQLSSSSAHNTTFAG